MNLLIDMGNTRLKWAVAGNGHFNVGQPLLNGQINRQELIVHWKKIARPHLIAISCVGKIQLLALVQSVALELWFDINIIVAKSEALAFGVTNAYPQPGLLGVDRWLSLISAWQTYQRPACIVDCGTAITVDMIDAEGRHQGGLISPGLMLMQKSLAYGTEALSVCKTNEPITALSNHTQGAIYNGTLMAAIGLIEHVMASYPNPTQLILTGGDAGLIAGQLGIPYIVDADLVLRGLQYLLEG
jgi:type III pantothenate kinase